MNCRFEAIRANRSYFMKIGFFCESIRANSPVSHCESPGHLSFAETSSQPNSTGHATPAVDATPKDLTRECALHQLQPWRPIRKTREGWNCRFQKTSCTEGWVKVQGSVDPRFAAGLPFPELQIQEFLAFRDSGKVFQHFSSDSQRAHRSKKFNLARNFQSRSKF